MTASTGKKSALDSQVKVQPVGWFSKASKL